MNRPSTRGKSSKDLVTRPITKSGNNNNNNDDGDNKKQPKKKRALDNVQSIIIHQDEAEAVSALSTTKNELAIVSNAIEYIKNENQAIEVAKSLQLDKNIDENTQNGIRNIVLSALTKFQTDVIVPNLVLASNALTIVNNNILHIEDKLDNITTANDNILMDTETIKKQVDEAHIDVLQLLENSNVNNNAQKEIITEIGRIRELLTAKNDESTLQIVASMDVEVEKVQSQSDLMLVRIDEMQKALITSSQTQYNNIIESYNNEIARKDFVLNSLQQQIQERDNSINAKSQEIITYQNVYNNLKSEYQSLNDRNQQLIQYAAEIGGAQEESKDIILASETTVNQLQQTILQKDQELATVNENFLLMSNNAKTIEERDKLNQQLILIKDDELKRNAELLNNLNNELNLQKMAYGDLERTYNEANLQIQIIDNSSSDNVNQEIANLVEEKKEIQNQITLLETTITNKNLIITSGNSEKERIIGENRRLTDEYKLLNTKLQKITQKKIGRLVVPSTIVNAYQLIDGNFDENEEIVQARIEVQKLVEAYNNLLLSDKRMKMNVSQLTYDKLTGNFDLKRNASFDPNESIVQSTNTVDQLLKLYDDLRQKNNNNSGIVTTKPTTTTGGGGSGGGGSKIPTKGGGGVIVKGGGGGTNILTLYQPSPRLRTTLKSIAFIQKESHLAQSVSNVGTNGGLYQLTIIFSTEYDKKLFRSHELVHRSVSLIPYEGRRVFYANMKNNDDLDVVYFTGTTPHLLWPMGYVQYYVKEKYQKGLDIDIVSTPEPVAYTIDMSGYKLGNELSVKIDNTLTLSGTASVLNLFKLDGVLLNFPF